MTKAGIYKITNKINNKIYIGQSIDIDRRFKNHVNHLTKFKHPNRYLQNSVNKYNLENFVFEIIETVEPFTSKDKKATEILNYLEMFYIESYEALTHQNGYNVQPGGDNHSGYFLQNTTQYTFYSPTNEEIIINNLPKYCKEHGLRESTMRAVFREDLKNHKGWTKYKKSSEPKYRIKSPSGVIYEFNYLKEFALAHDLNPHLLSSVSTGNIPHHKYWSLPETELKYKKIKSAVNKNIKYDWINTVTGETICCTVFELAKKYNIQSQTLYQITYPSSGRRSHHNWTLSNIDDIKANPNP